MGVIRLIGGLTAIAVLAGCSSYPTCGTREAMDAVGKPCVQANTGSLAGTDNSNSSHVAEFFSALSSTLNSNQRNYSTNPITLPQPMPGTQPTFGPVGSDGYQTITVNTPNGMVYKRCKVLNGQVVACF